MRQRKQRFVGAGGSAEREFNRQRRRNIRDEWRTWLIAGLGVVGFAIWSFYTGRIAGRLLAAAAGSLLGVLMFMWSLGGRVSAFRWRIGAEGERETAKEIERLGPEWHCEHDLEHARGNFDHVLVGPPGVFLLDSKSLTGTSAAGGDYLRSGRLSYPGVAFRSGALTVKVAIERQLGWRAPWVQAVVVVWGEFPQARHEEQGVVYLRGQELRSWLAELPQKVNAPQRAALTAALREARDALLQTPAV